MSKDTNLSYLSYQLRKNKTKKAKQNVLKGDFD